MTLPKCAKPRSEFDVGLRLLLAALFALASACSDRNDQVAPDAGTAEHRDSARPDSEPNNKPTDFPTVQPDDVVYQASALTKREPFARHASVEPS